MFIASRIVSIILIFNQSYLYGQYDPSFSRETTNYDSLRIKHRIETEEEERNISFKMHDIEYATDYTYLEKLNIEAEFLVKDMEQKLAKFTVEDIYNRDYFIKNFKELMEYKNAFKYVKDSTNKFNIKEVEQNLKNYLEIIKTFRACNDGDRNLCKSTIAYLSSQNIREEAKAYSIILNSSLKKIYIENLKQIGRTILEIEYRLLNEIPNINNLSTNLCLYETKSDTINNCTIDEFNELKKHFAEYFESIKDFKRYSFDESSDLFNKKLDGLNKILSDIPVVKVCDIKQYKAILDERKNSSNELSRVTAKANFEVYSLSKAYKADTDRRTYSPSSLGNDKYNQYQHNYFELAKSLIGSIVLNRKMQSNDMHKEYYDQGLRLVNVSDNFLEKISGAVNDIARLIGDKDNKSREKKLMCSRYHRAVNKNQVSEAILELKDNLYEYSRYINLSIVTKSSDKAIRRMFRYSPMLIAKTLKHNPHFKDEILTQIIEIKDEDDREELSINILRGAAVLSLLALPFGGAGLWGSAVISGFVRGGAALTGVISSLGEFYYAGVLKDERINNSSRISLVYKAFEALESSENVRAANSDYFKTYNNLVEAEELNRMMLALEFLGIFGDSLELVKYAKGLGRFKKVARALNVDGSKIISLIAESGNKERYSANLLDAINRIGDEANQKKIIERLNSMSSSDLEKFLEKNARGWSSKKIFNEFDSWLKPGQKLGHNSTVITDLEDLKKLNKDDLLNLVDKNVKMEELDKIILDKKFFYLVKQNNFTSDLYSLPIDDIDKKWIYLIRNISKIYEGTETEKIKLYLFNFYFENILKPKMINLEYKKLDIELNKKILGNNYFENTLINENTVNRFDPKKWENIDTKLNRFLKFGKSSFEVDRELLDSIMQFYSFREEVLTYLEGLNSNDHIIDMGAGNLYSMLEYLGLRKPNKIYSNGIIGIEDLDNRVDKLVENQIGEKSKVTAISYTINFDYHPNKNLKVIEGKFFEDIDESIIIEDFGKASLILDVHGIMSYSKNPSLVLKKYLGLLKKDGRIYISGHFLNSFVYIKNEKITLLDWLKKYIPNLKQQEVLLEKDNICIIKIQYSDYNAINNLPYLDIKEYNTATVPPLRVFEQINKNEFFYDINDYLYINNPDGTWSRNN